MKPNSFFLMAPVFLLQTIPDARSDDFQISLGAGLSGLAAPEVNHNGEDSHSYLGTAFHGVFAYHFDYFLTPFLEAGHQSLYSSRLAFDEGGGSQLIANNAISTTDFFLGGTLEPLPDWRVAAGLGGSLFHLRIDYGGTPISSTEYDMSLLFKTSGRLISLPPWWSVWVEGRSVYIPAAGTTTVALQLRLDYR